MLVAIFFAHDPAHWHLRPLHRRSALVHLASRLRLALLLLGAIAPAAPDGGGEHGVGGAADGQFRPQRRLLWRRGLPLGRDPHVARLRSRLRALQSALHLVRNAGLEPQTSRPAPRANSSRVRAAPFAASSSSSSSSPSPRPPPSPSARARRSTASTRSRRRSTWRSSARRRSPTTSSSASRPRSTAASVPASRPASTRAASLRAGCGPTRATPTTSARSPSGGAPRPSRPNPSPSPSQLPLTRRDPHPHPSPGPSTSSTFYLSSSTFYPGPSTSSALHPARRCSTCRSWSTEP